MQELISKLTEKAGISPEQAAKAVDTIKDFVKEKFPMMAGAVDNLFAESAASTTAVADPAAPVAKESYLDKISDFIPGETGQKVEDFAKNASDKLSGMFGGDKK